MAWRRHVRLSVIALAVLTIGGAGYVGSRFVSTLLTWRHLDATYQESFPAPTALAPELNGRPVVFHVKTGLAQDDSQICVGFNIVFAALEAGADVTVLFDAGAVLDLRGKRSNLERTGVPMRLRKVIAEQLHVPLSEMPSNYRQYLDLLADRGARMYANTAMRIVIGDAEQVLQPFPSYPYIEPATYTDVARVIADAERLIVY